MEQMIEGLLAAGVEREKIERARSRGIAYQCLRCLNHDGTKHLNIRCRVEDHIMRAHLGRDQLACYCKLCGFRCMKEEQLINHVSGYSKHILLASKAKVVNHEPYLMMNASPHVFGPADYKPLTREESLVHWLKYEGKAPKGENSTANPPSTSWQEPSQQMGQIHSPTVPSLPPLGSLSPALQQVQMQPLLTTPVVPQFPTRQPASQFIQQPMMNLVRNNPQQSPLLTFPTAGQQVMTSPAGQVQTTTPAPVLTPGNPVVEQITTLVGPIIDQMTATEQLTTFLKSLAGIVTTPKIGSESKTESAPGQTVTNVQVMTEDPVAVDRRNVVVNEEAAAVESSEEQLVLEAPPSAADTSNEIEHGYGLEETDSEAPIYIPTPIKTQDERESKKEDVLELEDEDMSIASPAAKRGLEEGQENDQEKKRQREEMASTSTFKGKWKKVKASARKGETTDDQTADLQVNIGELNRHTLVEMIGRSLEASERQMAQSAKILKAIEDSTHVVGKMVDAMTRMSRSMDDHYREQRKREDRYEERERNREEEYRKEMQRRREEEKHFEDRRREWERRERAEQREREERKKKEAKKSDEKEEGLEKEKENESRPRSVVKKVLGEKNTDRSRR